MVVRITLKEARNMRATVSPEDLKMGEEEYKHYQKKIGILLESVIKNVVLNMNL